MKTFTDVAEFLQYLKDQGMEAPPEMLENIQHMIEATIDDEGDITLKMPIPESGSIPPGAVVDPYSMPMELIPPEIAEALAQMGVEPDKVKVFSSKEDMMAHIQRERQAAMPLSAEDQFEAMTNDRPKNKLN